MLRFTAPAPQAVGLVGADQGVAARSERGCVAVEDIRADELLLEIPVSCCLSVVPGGASSGDVPQPSGSKCHENHTVSISWLTATSFFVRGGSCCVSEVVSCSLIGVLSDLQS